MGKGEATGVQEKLAWAGPPAIQTVADNGQAQAERVGGVKA